MATVSTDVEAPFAVGADPEKLARADEVLDRLLSPEGRDNTRSGGRPARPCRRRSGRRTNQARRPLLHPGLAATTVEEALRYEPIVTSNARTVFETIELGGQTRLAGPEPPWIHSFLRGVGNLPLRVTFR